MSRDMLLLRKLTQRSRLKMNNLTQKIAMTYKLKGRSLQKSLIKWSHLVRNHKYKIK